MIFNNLGKPGKLGAPDFPSSPAPSTVISKPSGIGRAIVFTVQALDVDHGTAGAKSGSVTNGIVVRVE